MNYPKVIVLILSYNGKELLEESISSYFANDYPNFKVAVIDNGSSDGTQKYVKNNFPSVELMQIKKNRGYSGGFNFGLDLQAKYYIIIIQILYRQLAKNMTLLDGMESILVIEKKMKGNMIVSENYILPMIFLHL